MYKIGEVVVYGNEGVCVLEDISELVIPGTNESKNYYNLQPMHNRGKIFTPVDTKVFMRPVITSEELNQLILEIPSLEKIDTSVKNSKALQDSYKNLLSTHDCKDLLRVIVSLNDKRTELLNNGKKLGQMEDKFFKQAKNLIIDEFSVVLNISKEDTEEYLMNKIN